MSTQHHPAVARHAGAARTILARQQQRIREGLPIAAAAVAQAVGHLTIVGTLTGQTANQVMREQRLTAPERQLLYDARGPALARFWQLARRKPSCVLGDQCHCGYIGLKIPVNRKGNPLDPEAHNLCGNWRAGDPALFDLGNEDATS